MSKRADSLLFACLVLLITLSPLPLGSNHEWSWSLLSLVAGVLCLAWGLVHLRDPGAGWKGLHQGIPLLFLAACAWIWVQQAQWVPLSWQHPLWGMASEVLGRDLPGQISLAREDTLLALMRLLGYGLVFFLALQLARDRTRARRLFGWLTIAGLAYALFGLAVYWGEHQPAWLFGERGFPPDLRSTFVNRNHFATWQGLTLLCALAWFYQSLSKVELKPYRLPTDRGDTIESFVLKAWKPMIAVLLMVTALVLTHSRGGFAATMGRHPGAGLDPGPPHGRSQRLDPRGGNLSPGGRRNRLLPDQRVIAGPHQSNRSHGRGSGRGIR